jgi:hypothetical protein
MKPILAIGVVAALGGGLPAFAQTDDLLARPLPSASTGPTVPDTRPVDQALLAPATNVEPAHPNTTNGAAPWRTSDGFNADPGNPNGAPGGGSVSTNPAR